VFKVVLCGAKQKRGGIMQRKSVLFTAAVFFLGAMLLSGADLVFAHCDTLDGPVVKAAQKALETGNVNFVLIWVLKENEAEIKAAFEKTLAVRKLGPEAAALADTYFFETVVRVHQTGEGAPYTGLKKAGEKVDSVVIAADKSLEISNIEPLLQVVKDSMCEGIHARFKEANDKKNYASDDVAAGRKFVEAYAAFLQYVEGIYAAAKKPGAGYSEKEEAEKIK
jgi:hypothetical protein